jgi:transposase
MQLELSNDERAALEAAAASERRVRQWRRYRAVLWCGEQPVEQVATTLGCGRATVYAWAAAYRAHGLAGVVVRPRGHRPPLLSDAAIAVLERRLSEDPQTHGQHATGWTVPLLQAELAAEGHVVSERTIRRTLHRRGWRWKRPKYVLGRPDPAYAEKKTS